MQRYLLVPILTIISLPVYTANVLVETTSGYIRGFTQDIEGTTVYTYLGIPFAQPPVGDLRFRRPVPIEKWTDVFNATSLGNSCVQIPFESFQDKKGKKSEDAWNPNTALSEDCLHLNIWVPEVSAGSAKLTTMVWIYGGGFVTGTSTLDVYNGAMLAALQNVIVVSMNYRLGPLGFLYLDTEEAPGNMGLLDQQLALQWIHSNVVYFGGSPQDLTLFGESAGAASVAYHMMANDSRDLFHSAILQSGSSLAHWAYNSPEVSLKYAENLAKAFDCESPNRKSMISCLRDVDAGELSKRMFYLSITPVTFNFVPTIDNQFIYESPSKFINSGHFPAKKLLLGVNRNEALYFLFYAIYAEMEWPNNTLSQSNYLKILPLALSNNGFEKLEIKKDKLVIDAILDRYESNLLPGDTRDYLMILDDIIGDFAFKCPVIQLAQNYAKSPGSSVYFYEFNHRPSVSDWPAWSGSLHGDEVQFLFGLTLKPEAAYTMDEQKLSQDMMQYWTNFAKTGKPSADWDIYSHEDESYRKLTMQIGPYDSILGRGLKHSYCQFWNDFLPKLKESLKQAQSKCECGTSTGNGNSTSHVMHALIITVVLCTSLLILVR